MNYVYVFTYLFFIVYFPGFTTIKKMEESTALLELPYEIIEIIFGYCKGSLIDIACCCKDLCNSVLPTLWHNVSITATQVSLQKIKQFERLKFTTSLSLDYGNEEFCKIIFKYSNPAILVKVCLSGNSIPDVVLSHLSSLAMLKELYISANKITDLGTPYLRNLILLQKLDVSDNGISDVGMSHLSSLIMLKELYIRRNKITDLGTSYLRNLALLEKLDVSDNDISDVGISHLSSLSMLK